MAASWQVQLRRAARSLDELRARFFPGMEITPGMREAERRFPVSVTEHYASLVRTPDFSDPVFRQCVPSEGELLPALPSVWKDGSIKGFKLPGGSRIDLVWEDYKVVSKERY